jgi:hypothetical protein
VVSELSAVLSSSSCSFFASSDAALGIPFQLLLEISVHPARMTYQPSGASNASSSGSTTRSPDESNSLASARKSSLDSLSESAIYINQGAILAMNSSAPSWRESSDVSSDCGSLATESLCRSVIHSMYP